MALDRVIADLERELASEQEQLRVMAARVAGKEAELRALRAGLEDQGDLAGLDRTDAILTVLRRSEASLTSREIADRLEAEGRDDSTRLVSATLNYLLQQARVQRPERGRYRAA